MTERQTISVDVVSDVVCPWCFIGKRRLERAIETLPEVDVAVHWCICVIGTGAAYAEGAIATNLDRGLVYADPIASPTFGGTAYQ